MSNKVDLVVKNAKIVSPAGIVEAGLAVKGEKFVAIAKDEELPQAEKIIDAKGNYVMPGIVEEHIHILDMKLNEWGDYAFDSGSAAVGGVTTVMEMPLTVPPTTTLEAFLEKKEVASKKFRVDFALYGGVVPGQYQEVCKMAEAGAVGFKSMMAGSVPGVFEASDDGELLEGFRAIAECDSVITVHCENDAIINMLENKLKSAGRKDMQAFFESRPISQEIDSIKRALFWADVAGCHLHVVHVSCPEGISIIKEAKYKGQRVTCETGPHYLVLSQEDGDRIGPYMKFAPPARSKKHTEELWKQLAKGDIDTLASDHGPHPKENKEAGWKDIWVAGNGAIGLEAILPVMLSEGVNKGRISFEKLVELLSQNPARIFGLYPQKGAIQIGSDADFVIVDLNKEFVIDAEKFYSKQKHSPFNGFEGKGKPIMTVVRGNIVAEEGKLLSEPGFGKFISRKK
ncbi:MAG: allantoinase AllB [Atribacterota bacterium]|nr:allantoinase AllB [Atribacterota bacterium]